MAPPPRGVLFGPIVDWGKGSSKVLLEFIDDRGIRRMRQYVLEEVTKWHLVPGFGENGSRALSQACANTKKCKSEWQGGEDWDLHISQQERQGRGNEEVLRVRDCPSAERAIEILRNGLTIQDSSVNGRLEGFDFTYEQAEAEDNVLESITVDLVDPKADLAGVEAEMEEFQEEVESKSEDERRRKRNTRLGKKPCLGEYGGGLEPAKARSFEEVVRSFGESEEDTTMEDIPSTATRMKKNQGLKDSRHAVIDLTEEEVDRMAEEVIEGQGQDRGKEKMGGDKEDVMEVEREGTGIKNRSWKPVWDTREAMTIIYGIKMNGEVLEEINALGPKERSWKSARDAKVARNMIKAGGGCIEGGGT
ncbi:hypothetical protein BGX38DRAFT_1270857 [Terfezia claveryi]|nr:hypothetical protein BGX38DRAFT_1270857 [Terfezia claveryi]